MLEVSAEFVATMEAEEYVQCTFSSKCKGGGCNLFVW